MYGLNGLGEEDLRQLLGFQLPEEQQAFQAQEPTPQLTQGLLGDVGAAGQQQQQNLNDLIGKTLNRSANIGQIAQMGAQAAGGGQNARMAQEGMQAALQQRQEEAQAGAMLGKIASLFLPGGSMKKFVQKKWGA